jgi:hypothetical protein
MKERKREAVYVSEVFLLIGSLEVPKHPWAHTLMWLSLRRTHKYMNLPYNMKPFRKKFQRPFFGGPRPHPPSHTSGNHEHPNRLNQILFFHLYVQF